MLKPNEEIVVNGKLYLRRWWLRKPDNNRPFRVYLHNMLASDDGRALHDHVSDNLSIILWGGYIEHVFERPPVEGVELPPVVQKRRRMFSIIYRKADQAHRLELYTTKVNGWDTDEDIPCWSLFITWRKRRPWGFWGTKEGVVGEHHVPVTRQLEDGKVREDWLTLQHKGPVAHWLHNLIFDTFSKLKG